MGERVVVAMSGGVDSSVAAALLLEAGHQPIGLTLRFWLCQDRGGDGGESAGARGCCGLDGASEARAAAGELGIPHYVVDCREEFERLVLRPAWEEYARGRTPNPCVLCNEEVKLGLLLARARTLGATRLATGHYARLEDQAGVPALLRGRDRAKDQSYFLFSLTPEQLACASFPLGDLTKGEVRALARRHGLPNAERRESQDACLGVGAEGFAEALRLRFGGEARPGELVDEAGRVLGRHPGLHHFTVGQRRGLGIALGRRAYVLRLDAERAAVVIGESEEALAARGLLARQVRWLAPGAASAAASELRCEVQIRYRHAATPARARLCGEALEVRFDEPQRAVTPGQAAVLYDGERVLGGGWIEAALPA